MLKNFHCYSTDYNKYIDMFFNNLWFTSKVKKHKSTFFSTFSKNSCFSLNFKFLTVCNYTAEGVVNILPACQIRLTNRNIWPATYFLLVKIFVVSKIKMRFLITSVLEFALSLIFSTIVLIDNDSLIFIFNYKFQILLSTQCFTRLKLVKRDLQTRFYLNKILFNWRSRLTSFKWVKHCIFNKI